MNPLDTYAPADASAAEEAAYDNAANTISKLDGEALFNSGAVDIDSLLDAFNLPDVFIDTIGAGVTWGDLSEGEQDNWADLAAVIRAFGYERLDEDKATEHAGNLAA